MFYSQFILAKKGPLGTIWIAAHLERKLKKNQVADTDIGVSVDSILFPEVPIALRLSSHLLLGVVRIYSRKVNYLFHDCSEALLKVKQAFRSTAVDLPPEESTAPYHSITLPETFDLDDFELPDSDLLHGNFDDRHVSTREQITLQDTLDHTGYSTSQFGLDERFGDGDASQMGLDLDEELLLDNNLTLQDASVFEGAMHKVEGATDLTKIGIEEDHHGCHEGRNDEASKELSELLGGNRGNDVLPNVENVHRTDASSHRLIFNIQTPDLNEVFLSDDHAGGMSAIHDIDMGFDPTDPPSRELNQSANFPSTPGLLEEAVESHSEELPASNPQNIPPDTATETDNLDTPINQEVECPDVTTGPENAASASPKSTNLAQAVSSHTLVLGEPKPDSAVPITGDGQNHVESKDIQSTSSTLVLTEAVANSLVPQFSIETVATPVSINQEVECPDVTTGPANAASASPNSTNLAQTVSSPTLVLGEPRPDSAVPITGDGQNHVESKDIHSTSSTLVLTEAVANSLVPQSAPVSINQEVECPDVTTGPANAASASPNSTNLAQTVSSPTLVLGEPKPDSAVPITGDGQNHVESKDIHSTSSTLVLTEAVANSLVPQSSIETVAAPVSDPALREADTLQTGIPRAEANGQPVSMDYSLVSGIASTIGVPHADSTRLSNLDQGRVEDANSCQTSNFSTLSSVFHLRPCTSESNQTSLISSCNMVQERALGEQPCNLETPLLHREMHFSGSLGDPQGFHSVISTVTNLGLDQNSADVLLGLQSGVSNPIELPTYYNLKDVPSGHWNCFSSSEFSEPERMRFAVSGNANLSNDLGQQTTEKGVIESDGSVDRISNLSGQKRRLADNTPTLQNNISPKTSGIPRKKRNIDYIPNDDDLLASILVGRRTPAMMIGPTPPLPKPPSLKRPRLTAKAGFPKRRKVLLDDTIVFHADAIRQQLINTEDIRRLRKKAPCTRPEIWRIQRSSLEDDIFCESIFTGVSEALHRLVTRTHDLSLNMHSQVNAHHSSGEASKEVELSRSFVFRDNDEQEMAKQNVVLPKGCDDEMQVPSAISESVGVESHKNTVPVDAQEQLESPVDLHHVNSPHNTISSAELDILGHPGIVPVTHAASNSGIEEKHDDLCTDTDQNSPIKAFQTSHDFSEVNNNLLHAADVTSFEDFASADCAEGAGVVSNNGVAAIDNDTSLEGKDFSNVKNMSITVEDMGVDVVNVDNLDCPQDGLANRGKENCGGESVSTHDKFMVEIGKDFPSDPSTVIGCVDASVSGMVLAGGGPVTSDYQAMNESEAGKVTVEYEIAVDEERSVPELPGGETPHIDSSPVPRTESERVPSAVGENSCLNREGGLDVESNPMECAATRESSDFCSAIDDIDTDFLNVDDDDIDEYDEAANNDEPNAEEAQSLENSGWSSRTRGVARYLKNMFDQESGRMRKSVAIDHLLAGKTRKEASRMFFETLVLKTKDYIHVEQETPFDRVDIKPRIKLLKSEF